MQKLPSILRSTSLETRLALLAVAAGLVNLWVGLLVAFAAVSRLPGKSPSTGERHNAALFFAPTGLALVFLSQGTSLPQDDLLRHLTAGAIAFDYRAQYPWSTLPQANLWLGFDWVLWQLQLLGLSKELLRLWLPGLCILLQSLVLYAALNRVCPPRMRNKGLFLLAGGLGLVLLTPRALLGRPEMFLLIFAASAWLPRSSTSVAAWAFSFLALIPTYWLGWVYAPFALLLWPERLSLRTRIALALGLAGLHLSFWQWYSGDYAGLMLWLQSTLSVPATENAPLLRAFAHWPGWVLFGALALGLAQLNQRRLRTSAAVLLLMLWLALPNQIRYLPGIAFVALPWLYRQLCLSGKATRWTTAVPSHFALLGLAMATALAVPTIEPVPEFRLPANARVYSESPYATVFYGVPGIAVEPSFALGATNPAWRDLKDPTKQADHCKLLQSG